MLQNQPKQKVTRLYVTSLLMEEMISMTDKKDLRNDMIHGLNNKLDSLIQPTAYTPEPEQPKKEKAVHCNFVINQSIHTRLKTLAIRKGITLKDAIQEAALEYLNKYE